MAGKALIQGLVLLVLFFGIWFGFRQVDFVSLFHVNEIRDNTANKLGELIWQDIAGSETVIRHDSVIELLDKLVLPICEHNAIERDSLKIHIVEKNEVNAFALPGNHLIIYTGLIRECKRQEAFQGVIGHEMAHIQNNHVMRKLSKEIGLSALLSATAGDKGGQVLKQVFHTLSSSAYDRILEEEADLDSVRYLINANINPEPMADFMYTLSMKQELPDSFYWIATHPESEARAKSILNYLKGKKYKGQPTLSEEEWQHFQDLVN
jgi:beta-barrel assembly-enhancing protease